MDHHKINAFIWAVFSQNLEIVKLLIKNGADLKAKTVYGLAPLEFSALFIVKEEIRLEEDWNEDDNTILKPRI